MVRCLQSGISEIFGLAHVGYLERAATLRSPRTQLAPRVGKTRRQDNAYGWRSSRAHRSQMPKDGAAATRQGVAREAGFSRTWLCGLRESPLQDVDVRSAETQQRSAKRLCVCCARMHTVGLFPERSARSLHSATHPCGCLTTVADTITGQCRIVYGRPAAQGMHGYRTTAARRFVCGSGEALARRRLHAPFTTRASSRNRIAAGGVRS